MYYLREIEEQIDEYRRVADAAMYDQRDVDALQEIRRAGRRSLRKSIAGFLVQSGLKLDPRAVSYVASHEAA